VCVEGGEHYRNLKQYTKARISGPFRNQKRIIVLGSIEPCSDEVEGFRGVGGYHMSLTPTRSPVRPRAKPVVHFLIFSIRKKRQTRRDYPQSIINSLLSRYIRRFQSRNATINWIRLLAAIGRKLKEIDD
jgi:hypothetical protein